MKFYTQQHQFYCGVDLHARSLYVCILDQAGDGPGLPPAPLVSFYCRTGPGASAA